MTLEIYPQISNKDITEFYEYWCFIKLGAILKEKHELINTKASGYYRDGLSAPLKKGHNLL
nr:nuclease domain-containing protein [Cellulosilyticum ruminicola]